MRGSFLLLLLCEVHFNAKGNQLDSTKIENEMFKICLLFTFTFVRSIHAEYNHAL